MEATVLATESGQFSDRHRLLADLAAARRRIVAARNALAGSRDAQLRAVLSIQRSLADEQLATNGVLLAIKSGADREVARILGPCEPGVERPDLQWLRGTATPPRVIGEGPAFHDGGEGGDPDPVCLKAQLDWLVAKAEIVEGHAQLAMADRSNTPREATTVLLESILNNVVESTREHHRLSRDRATTVAHERLAAARAEAEKRPTSSPLRRPEPPVAPEGSPQAHRPAPARTKEDPQTAWPVARAASPRKENHSRLMVADVLVALIALAIVVIVVLSWVGW